MNLLITLLKAAHCRSTHHHFAIDALAYVSNRRGKLLANLLLKHYDQYLQGAKDPDKRFRDFRNHVLHVADNDWGGATTASEKWYRQLIVQLDRERWGEAAYAAGVLSHYFTDPLMPLHTGQSEAESIVHRPIEWSINQSYSRILKQFQNGDVDVVFELADDPGWLSHAIKKAARVANRHYAGLIRGYDLAVGVKQPKHGFNDATIEILSGLFGLAIVGWSKVLERAANDSRTKIPAVNVTAATVVAAMNMPSAWVLRRVESLEERRAIRSLFAEFNETGRVVDNLPPEVVTVREERELDRIEGVAPEPSSPATVTQSVARKMPAAAGRPAGVPARSPSLSRSDPIVDAPSIGPKTAKRFHAIGIDTVHQFLAESPQRMASSLDTSWIDAELLQRWQDQAKLICEVPGLCGYKSQLLVGADCRSRETLAQENPENLHDRISSFAATSAGKRALRSSRLPSREDVAEWIRDASENPLRRTA